MGEEVKLKLRQLRGHAFGNQVWMNRMEQARVSFFVVIENPIVVKSR